MLIETLTAIGIMCAGMAKPQECQGKYITCVNDLTIERLAQKRSVTQTDESVMLAVCIVGTR